MQISSARSDENETLSRKTEQNGGRQADDAGSKTWRVGRSMTKTSVSVGPIELKSPLICGAGEHLMYAQGVRRALAAGAAAVVPKSVNETEAGRRQLDRTDYALLGSDW